MASKRLMSIGLPKSNNDGAAATKSAAIQPYSTPKSINKQPTNRSTNQSIHSFQSKSMKECAVVVAFTSLLCGLVEGKGRGRMG
jgi:hypothetical protein